MKIEETTKICKCGGNLERRHQIEFYCNFIVIRIERINFDNTNKAFYCNKRKKEYFQIELNKKIEFGKFVYQIVGIVLETEVHATA